MASPPALAHPNVQLSYGPMLIGVFFNMILYGVLLVQTMTYYQVYRRDPTGMRLFVGFLFFVETANTSLDMAILYQPLILDYGEKPVFFPTVFMTEPLCIVLVSMPIQIFFAWRIHQLTNSLWIPAIISVFAIASFAGGVWTATMIQILRQFAKKPLLHNSALLWFLAACVADILITISLVVTLSKKKTGFSATDSVLDKIIRSSFSLDSSLAGSLTVFAVTIQTGMITALFSILDVACFMILPASPVQTCILAVARLTGCFAGSITPYFVWDLSLSKLYSNCLMSTLNARERLNSASNQSTFQQRRSVVLSPARSGSGKQARNFGESFFHSTTEPLGSVTTYDGDEDRPGPDLEYGIHMTKIVERITDPLQSSTAQ
ncbi:hypothetical protein B0H12DRAFT_1232583 [Mycena haematopus]|nr:hypothetical protein B0H12DRAFT_1232583 [Mycena haematopus]